MMRLRLILLAALLSFQTASAPANASSLPAPFPHPDLQFLTTLQGIETQWLGATAREVYQWTNQHSYWKSVFSLSGINERIHFILPIEDRLFIGASNGLFASDLSGSGRTRIFSSFDSLENQTHCLATHSFSPAHLFLGTGKGLFTSPDAGKTWTKCSLPLSSDSVLAVASHPNIPNLLFLYTSREILRLKINPFVIESIWQFGNETTSNEAESSEEDNLSPTHFLESHFLFSSNNDQRIFLASPSGLYFSLNAGKTWEKSHHPVLEMGMRNSVYSLSLDLVLFQNDRGLWSYDGNQAEPLITGTIPISAMTTEENLFNRRVVYVSQQQFFELPLPDRSAGLLNTPRLTQDVEMAHPFLKIAPDLATVPGIRALQTAAIEYSHLGTERMRGWENRVRWRGLLPGISFGLSSSVANNIDVDRGSTTEPDHFLIGPEETDLDLEFGVNWDLADLIWNNTETSIEIRERALVDQREEVLSEITRLYFEYKRLEGEYRMRANMNAEEELNNGLRRQEILALLDGFTGGYITSYNNH